MYCKYCGKEISDNSSYCPYCGKQINAEINTSKKSMPLSEIAFIFMIVSCVIYGLSSLISAFIVPFSLVLGEVGLAYSIITLTISIAGLASSIVMTILLYKANKAKTKTSIAFNIITLLLVSTIAGILLLVDKSEYPKQDSTSNTGLNSEQLDRFN